MDEILTRFKSGRVTRLTIMDNENGKSGLDTGNSSGGPNPILDRLRFRASSRNGVSRGSSSRPGSEGTDTGNIGIGAIPISSGGNQNDDAGIANSESENIRLRTENRESDSTSSRAGSAERPSGDSSGRRFSFTTDRDADQQKPRPSIHGLLDGILGKRDNNTETEKPVRRASTRSRKNAVSTDTTQIILSMLCAGLVMLLRSDVWELEKDSPECLAMAEPLARMLSKLPVKATRAIEDGTDPLLFGYAVFAYITNRIQRSKQVKVPPNFEYQTNNAGYDNNQFQSNGQPQQSVDEYTIPSNGFGGFKF